MQPSTLARQTSSPSASSPSMPPSSISSTLATFRNSVISYPLRYRNLYRRLNAATLHGEDRAGHAVAGGTDQEDRRLDNLLHADPFRGQFFRRGVHRVQVGLRYDQARANGIDINTELFPLFGEGQSQRVHASFGGVIGGHVWARALRAARATEVENLATALPLHHRPDGAGAEKGRA